MPPPRHTAPGGRAESRPAHAARPPLEPEHTTRPCPTALPAAGSCPGHRRRHHSAPTGDGREYDHLAAAAYLMKHARSAALVVLGARHGSRPVGVITDA